MLAANPPTNTGGDCSQLKAIILSIMLSPQSNTNPKFSTTDFSNIHQHYNVRTVTTLLSTVVQLGLLWDVQLGFYRPDALPVTKPTVCKSIKGKQCQKERKTPISNRGRWSSLSLFRQIHLGEGTLISNQLSGSSGIFPPLGAKDTGLFSTACVGLVQGMSRSTWGKACITALHVCVASYRGSSAKETMHSPESNVLEDACQAWRYAPVVGARYHYYYYYYVYFGGSSNVLQ